MLIFKVIGIGIIGAVLSVLIKQYRAELAPMVGILTVVAIFSVCMPYLNAVLKAFIDIAETANIELSYVRTVIKIIGVAYVCQFASDICADAGERAISGKIELGGRVMIISMSMPIIYNMLNLISEMLMI